jgi:hypothetical protein
MGLAQRIRVKLATIAREKRFERQVAKQTRLRAKSAAQSERLAQAIRIAREREKIRGDAQIKRFRAKAAPPKRKATTNTQSSVKSKSLFGGESMFK